MSTKGIEQASTGVDPELQGKLSAARATFDAESKEVNEQDEAKLKNHLAEEKEKVETTEDEKRLTKVENRLRTLIKESKTEEDIEKLKVMDAEREELEQERNVLISKINTPEDLGSVDKTRTKYIDEFVKYRKESRAWQGFSKKTLENTVRNIGKLISKEKEEQFVKEKYPNLPKFKEEYDKARVAVGNKMYAEKREELEKTVASPEELKLKLDEYKNTEIRQRVYLDEQQEIANLRNEKLPPFRSEVLSKYWGYATMGMKAYSEWVNKGRAWEIGKHGYKLTLRKVAVSAALGAGTGMAFGPAAWNRWRYMDQ